MNEVPFINKNSCFVSNPSSDLNIVLQCLYNSIKGFGGLFSPHNCTILSTAIDSLPLNKRAII